MISHLTYTVERQASHWTVGFGNGDHAGRFPSRLRAVASALRDAERVRSLGYSVDVLVRRTDGSCKMVSKPADTTIPGR